MMPNPPPSTEEMTPQEARDYVAIAAKHLIGAHGRQITFVEFTGGRKVNLNDMSDEDAISVAIGLQQIELEAYERSKKEVH